MYLNELNGDGGFSDASSAHNDDFVSLCYTASITRLRHDDRRPAGSRISVKIANELSITIKLIDNVNQNNVSALCHGRKREGS